MAFSATAEAAIVYNESPSFQQTGDFFGKYHILPSLDYGGGFLLVQQVGQPETVIDNGGGDPITFPSSPSFSELYNSDSEIVLANLGDTISSASFFDGKVSLNNDGSGYYIGFRGTDSDTGSVYNGWFEVTVSGVGTLDDTVSFTLESYAYDDTGASIVVGNTGVIPEPSTYGLLFGGFTLAVVAMRRRTSKQA